MSLPSPLEKLVDKIETTVKDAVNKNASKCQSQITSNKKKSYIFHSYNPKSIDGNICPLIILNGECDTYKDSIDSITRNILQEYATKLQESRERRWFDTKFNSGKYEAKVNAVRNRRNNVAAAIAGVVTGVGTAYLLSGVLDSEYSQGSYIIGTMAGLTALLFESWFNPLGKLTMISYRKSRLLGTEQYEIQLKKYYVKKISKHLKSIDPQNPILYYSENLSKVCKN